MVMNNQTAIQIVSLAVAVLVILGGFVFWAGGISSDIAGLDGRFDAQDRRFDTQDRRFDAIQEQIKALDVDIDGRIETYDYHHHDGEDGAVVFRPSPRQQ